MNPVAVLWMLHQRDSPQKLTLYIDCLIFFQAMLKADM